MRSFLAKLGAVVRRQGHPQGFVYVPDGDEGPMRAAKAGVTVRNANSGPPWIVVDFSVDSVIAARWPGRLWRVEILQVARQQAGAEPNYARAVSVRVIEQLPVSSLFGPQGERVCQVIHRASLVTLEEVMGLGAAIHPLARQAYSRAWSRWLGRTEPESSEEHADTLAAVSEGSSGRSPIGSGFTVLYSVLTERARVLAGDSAFVVDEEGDPIFAPAWSAAAEAFLHAAMAFGASHIEDADARALTAAWATWPGTAPGSFS
jgi:hypothetical protein